MERLATKILYNRNDAANFSSSLETIHDHLRHSDKNIENISAVFNEMRQVFELFMNKSDTLQAMVSDQTREIRLLKNENQELKAVQNRIEASLANLTNAGAKQVENRQGR